MTLDLCVLPLIKNIYAENSNVEILWCFYPMNFYLNGVQQDQELNHFNLWGNGLEGSKQMLPYFIGGISMTTKRDKIWTTIIAIRQWFTKLFTSEADALVDDFGNNQPPRNRDSTLHRRYSRQRGLTY